MGRSWAVRIGLAMTSGTRSTAARGPPGDIGGQPPSGNGGPMTRETERPEIAGGGCGGRGRTRSRGEARGAVFEGCQQVRAHDVARDAHDEEIARPLVEQELRRYARIGAAQDLGDRILPLHAGGAAR